MPKGYGLSEATKEGIWELRAEGIERSQDRTPARPCRGTVSKYLARAGGIRPRAHRRPERCLSLEEREEISRGIARGHSARVVARALDRSHTTIGREITRFVSKEAHAEVGPGGGPLWRLRASLR